MTESISEGGRWINGKDVGLDWSNVRTTTALAFGTQSGASGVYNDSTAVLSGAWGPDQTVQATVKTAADAQTTSAVEEVELRLRTTITAHSITGYEIDFRAVKPGGYMAIVRWNGPLNSFTTLSTENNAYQGITTGDVVKASIVGSTITVYVNGIVVGQATDSTFASGSPGVGFWMSNAPESTSGDYGFMSFSASDGSMPTAPTPTPTPTSSPTPTQSPNPTPSPIATPTATPGPSPIPSPIITSSSSTSTSVTLTWEEADTDPGWYRL